MSLKAKLEAVIYAAEEPVTLAQIALLFAEDAFAWKAERDAENAPKLEFVPSGETTAAALDISIEAVLHEPGHEPGHERGHERDDEPREEVEAERQAALPEVEGAQSEVVAANNSNQPVPEPEQPVSDPELEAKRQARVRERQAREILREILDELIADYAVDSRGIEIREIAGGFRMGTKPEIHDAVRSFIKSLKPPMKLSLPALETLAVIAYKQPVTAPEVGEIRGVDSAGVLGSLLSRKLIATAGRKQVIGRPMLYKTTKEFLLRFGLKDLNELPSMEEFEKMAALELNEESLDESDDAAEPVVESGELFPEAETEAEPTLDVATEEAAEELPQTEEAETASPASNAEDTETSTPTAESSHEAAEAHAIVERQNAEEVEAEV
jgi:segregation and condensation protein B